MSRWNNRAARRDPSMVWCVTYKKGHLLKLVFLNWYRKEASLMPKKDRQKYYNNKETCNSGWKYKQVQKWPISVIKSYNNLHFEFESQSINKTECPYLWNLILWDHVLLWDPFLSLHWKCAIIHITFRHAINSNLDLLLSQMSVCIYTVLIKILLVAYFNFLSSDESVSKWK